MTRNTADYQRADSAHYIHPFTDSKALGTERALSNAPKALSVGQ